MTGWLLGLIIFSNECALIFSALGPYTFITDIDVKRRHEKTPQDFSTGVEFEAICWIYVKRLRMYRFAQNK